MRHVLSALVQNRPGVLSHISGMLASRGYNIDSLAVGETEDPRLSRMTFVVNGDEKTLDQVRKQLDKTGFPPDLQTLVDGVDDAASAKEGVKIYFLRRILEEDYVDDLSPGYVHHDSDLIWLDKDLVTSRSNESRRLIKSFPPVPTPEQVTEILKLYSGRFAMDFGSGSRGGSPFDTRRGRGRGRSFDSRRRSIGRPVHPRRRAKQRTPPEGER